MYASDTLLPAMTAALGLMYDLPETDCLEPADVRLDFRSRAGHRNDLKPQEGELENGTCYDMC